MSTLIEYKCGGCGFTASCCLGGIPYVSAQEHATRLYHRPAAIHEIVRFIKLHYGDLTSDEIFKVIQENGGNELRYICKECLRLTDLDAKRDVFKCKNCSCTDLILMEDLDFTICPSCKTGRFGAGTKSYIR